MAKMEMTIEVLEITRKGEHLGYKIYINDFVCATKLPRKPGDLKGRKREPGEYKDLDYYPLTVKGAVTQALEDWNLWKEQGYKRAEEKGSRIDNIIEAALSSEYKGVNN